MGFLNWLFGANKKGTTIPASNPTVQSIETRVPPVTPKTIMEAPSSLQPAEEPTELGVRQKIKIAETLQAQTCIYVTSTWVNVFEKLFPSPKGAANQLFVLCMQAATAWLVMEWYDLSHKKRTAQIMGWYELATRSKLIPNLILDMHSRQYRSPDQDTATGIELMKAKAGSYARWIHIVMEKQGVSIGEELIRTELEKARDGVQFWYDTKLIELIKSQKSWDATVPSQLPQGSSELAWINQRQLEISLANW